MGAFTPLAKVWYPDQNDTAKIDTLMATLASSIENGLQPRLALQEKAIGLKAGITASQTLATTFATMPFSIGSGSGQFNNGFSISSSGVVTVNTPGMYFVSAAITIAGTTTSHSVKIQIFQNSNALTYQETLAQNIATTVTSSTAINCVAGDTIYVQAADFNGGITTVAGGNYNHLTAVLIRPTPLVS